jgi:hypothetical protein
MKPGAEITRFPDACHAAIHARARPHSSLADATPVDSAGLQLAIVPSGEPWRT